MVYTFPPWAILWKVESQADRELASDPVSPRLAEPNMLRGPQEANDVSTAAPAAMATHAKTAKQQHLPQQARDNVSVWVAVGKKYLWWRGFSEEAANRIASSQASGRLSLTDSQARGSILRKH